jgi:GABA(A) receptor-associated protein
MPVGQFIFILRSRLHLSPGIALFVFVNNTLPQTGELCILGCFLSCLIPLLKLQICNFAVAAAQLMGSVYESYKDEDDGFLYMCYSSEKTFG